MAVKMRLMRMGKTKSPYYRVVVMDGRAPRDGRYIDLIGRYDPRVEPSVIEIDADKAVDWLRKGAQPTEAVAKLLEASGTLTEFKVRSGRIHTVAGAPQAEQSPGPDEAPQPETAGTEAAGAATEADSGEAKPGEADSGEAGEGEADAASEEE